MHDSGPPQEHPSRLEHPIQVLVAVDRSADAEAISEVLRGSSIPLEIRPVATDDELTASLQLTEGSLVVVTAGADREDFPGLRIVRRASRDVPVIVVAADAAAGFQAIHQGAADFITRDQLDELSVMVERAAINRSRLKQAARLDMQYRTLVEQLPGAVYRAEPGSAGRWFYVSPKVERLIGVSPVQLESDPSLWPSLVHPDDRELVLATEERVAATGEPFYAEYRVVRPDRAVVWIRDQAVTVHDPDGNLVLQGVLFDITEQKKIALEMESSLSMLRATLEATADGILVVDLEGRIVGFNRTFLRLWRIPEEVAGSGKDDALLAYIADQLADPEGFDARVRELYADPDAEAFDVVHFKDGRVYERFSIPQRIGNRCVGRVWSFRDQTEQRRAAERQRDSEARLRAIVESEPECVKLVDRDGRLIDMNPAGLGMIGAANLDDVMGLSVFQLIAPEDRDAFVALNDRIFDGESGSLEFVMIGLDGRRVRVDSQAAPLRDANGEVVAHLAITRDITDRHRLEQQLHQAQKLEAVGRLAGGVAHDFNNILAVIASYAQFLLEGLGDQDALRDDATEIIRASERAASLVRQLLAFSRKEVVRPTVLNLNEVIRSIQKLLVRTLGEDIELIVETSADVERVVMDRGQIEQVMLNLALNARDAMPSGGRLSIGTASVRLDEPTASMPSLSAGDYVCLSVRDSGVGMSEDVRAHIFEPFFTTKGRGEGTGLGLATVYGIVQQAGGDIDVESVVGEGTSFKVYLPASVDALSDPQAATSISAPGAGERILVVEDEDAVRRLVGRILEKSGYSVIPAASAEEAIALTDSNGGFDLLLTDVVMPGMSGKDLADHFCADNAATKVLFMSGYPEDIVAARGAVDPDRELLHKPFTAEALLSKVRQALNG